MRPCRLSCVPCLSFPPPSKNPSACRCKSGGGRSRRKYTASMNISSQSPSYVQERRSAFTTGEEEEGEGLLWPEEGDSPKILFIQWERAHGSRKGLGLVECLRHLLAAFVTGGGGKRGGERKGKSGFFSHCHTIKWIRDIRPE